MPFIQNVSLLNVKEGRHFNPGEQSVLIQICDPPGDFPVPKHPFSEIHQFCFLDLDDPSRFSESFTDLEEFRMTDEQALKIAEVLQSAFDKNKNVIVHCHAGKCRSGAVAEVGVMMGFEDTGVLRIPNAFVKKRLMKELGLSYESLFKP